MNLPDACLFDLDGVLIDTEGVYTRIWTDIELRYPTGIENFALKIKGNTLPRILDAYFPEPEIRKGVCDMLADSEEAMEYPVFEGVMEFLEELHDARIPSAIVTSSNDSKMQRLAAAEPRFMSMFDALITDSCVSHSKPHPEPYLKGAERLGVNPCRCIVFEDSLAGMASGRAAGAAVVGLATTNPRTAIADSADAVANSMRGLSLAWVLEALSAGGRSF